MFVIKCIMSCARYKTHVPETESGVVRARALESKQTSSNQAGSEKYGFLSHPGDPDLACLGQGMSGVGPEHVYCKKVSKLKTLTFQHSCVLWSLGSGRGTQGSFRGEGPERVELQAP